MYGLVIRFCKIIHINNIKMNKWIHLQTDWNFNPETEKEMYKVL